MVLPGKRAQIFLVVAGWLTIFPGEALAYLDPGTGSLIVQSVIAAVAAVGFGIRMYWGRIRDAVKWPRGRAGSRSERPPSGS